MGYLQVDIFNVSILHSKKIVTMYKALIFMLLTNK